MEIELANAVAVVRDELMYATACGVGQPMQFVVGPIEMEFTVELRQDTSAKAGFKAWVVSGDAGVDVSRGRTHRVSVTLTPVRHGGGDVLVGGDPDGPDGPGDISGRIGR